MDARSRSLKDLSRKYFSVSDDKEMLEHLMHSTLDMQHHHKYAKGDIEMTISSNIHEEDQVDIIPAITRVEIRKAPNYGEKDIFIHLNCPVKHIKPKMAKFSEEEDEHGQRYEVHFGENELGFVRFGVLYVDPENRPTGNSEFWTSNSGYISQVVDKPVREILVVGSDDRGHPTGGHAMTVETLNKLLAKIGYTLKWKKWTKEHTSEAWVPVKV